MRIMLDTNILVSALLFPSERMNRMMECISSAHSLVLSSFVVDELKDVVAEKVPGKTAAVDRFLAKANYEYVYTPEIVPEGLFEIRRNIRLNRSTMQWRYSKIQKLRKRLRSFIRRESEGRPQFYNEKMYRENE